MATISNGRYLHILPDVFYSKTAVKQILNISDTAYTNYRKDGLVAHKIGMEVYTRGNELIDFILTREGNPNLCPYKRKEEIMTDKAIDGYRCSNCGYFIDVIEVKALTFNILKKCPRCKEPTSFQRFIQERKNKNDR